MPARIIAKMNALVDPNAIEALYAASRAGVRIDLIVRGTCCLRPGLPGVSENIRVTSVVDKFLEHSRISYFQNGDEPEVYLASADWMPRNFRRRVEIMFPIEDPRLKSRIVDGLLGVVARRQREGPSPPARRTYVAGQAQAGRADGAVAGRIPEHGQGIVGDRIDLADGAGGHQVLGLQNSHFRMRSIVSSGRKDAPTKAHGIHAIVANHPGRSRHGGSIPPRSPGPQEPPQPTTRDGAEQAKNFGSCFRVGVWVPCLRFRKRGPRRPPAHVPAPSRNYEPILLEPYIEPCRGGRERLLAAESVFGGIGTPLPSEPSIGCDFASRRAASSRNVAVTSTYL